MKILITGGAGYIGTRLSNALYKEGHDITVFDNFTYGAQGLYPAIKVVKGDITNSDNVFEHFPRQEVVFHLAAISNDPTGNLDPEFTERVNFEGTTKVLNASRILGVKRFIFASSSSVIGIQSGTNTTENVTPNPLTPYSKTKLAAEMAVVDEASGRFTTCVLRPATVCGVSPRQRFDLVINALTGSAFFDEHITVYGGSQRRPNLAMPDMIRAYNTLLHAEEHLVNGEVFHVGWENMKVIDMAKLVASTVGDITGRKVSITVQEGTTDMRDYHITSDKITSFLDFEPFYTITDMIEELVHSMSVGYITGYKDKKYHNVEILKKNEDSTVPR